MLEKYIVAHERHYNRALEEIRNGRKRSHWIWFIFPQIRGLGYSENSKYYALNSVDEARMYMVDEVLKNHMVEICTALLMLESCDATEIMGWPDDVKLQSSMTLFAISNPEYDIFEKILCKFFKGEEDGKTLSIIQNGLGKRNDVKSVS